jgi:hypothetical protein
VCDACGVVGVPTGPPQTSEFLSLSTTGTSPWAHGNQPQRAVKKLSLLELLSPWAHWLDI